MHSSRMRAVRCSGHGGGAGVCLGVCPRVSAWRGGAVCLGGVCPGCLLGGCLLGGGRGAVGLPGGEGVCLRGVFTPACTEADTPLWTEFLTHACENITCPRTAVKIKEKICFYFRAYLYEAKEERIKEI